MKKKLLAAVLALVMTVSLLPAAAFAADSGKFIENDHWIELSSSEITQKYNNKETFVVMVFRHTCFNSKLRKVIVENWMDTYDLDVYGVDYDVYNMPRFLWDALNNDVTLPAICFVENGRAEAYDAKESMKTIQKRLQEHLGIYDESAIDFSKLDKEIFRRYSVDEETVRDNYLIPAGGIPGDIVTETQKIVSGKTTDREKLKAIYDWVTTNIFYNYDMASGKVQRRVSAYETYYYMNSVCEGYSNLTASMCHAAGIPCRVVSGFATGVNTDNTVDTVWNIYSKYLSDGDLDSFRSAIAKYENHAWNEAFVDGEWIILDTTWGSNNDYYPSSGGLIPAKPTDEYFDPDMDWFSESHLFWTDYSHGEEADPPEPPVLTDLAGDVNADGYVNATDKAILNRYLAGWKGYNKKILNWEAADINKDGDVTAQDKAILNRYLAGWKGYDQYFE